MVLKTSIGMDAFYSKLWKLVCQKTVKLCTRVLHVIGT